MQQPSLTVGLEQAAENREAASERLARKLVAERETFLAFVRGRVRSGADAEDIFQQALVKAATHASELRDPAHERAWFFQILRRTLADHHAQWALRESKLRALAAEMEEATPEEVATCACTLGQLEQLRPEYSEMLRRVDLDEQPLAEVAEALGITLNNTTVRLHRARRALRERLFTFCGAESVKACLDCDCD